jgi:biotin transport system ATP-binding protein
LLDLRNARMVTELLRQLPQQVVLVTHHLDLLAGFERVLVLHEGRLVADTDADEAVAAYEKLLG